MPEILFLQFTNPTLYPPLIQSALILQRGGWSTRFLGVRWPWGNFSFPDHFVGELELLSAPAPGWRQKVFYLRFQAWSVLQALLHQPRWIYVSDPMATPAGLLLSLMGFQVAYHEHDSPDDGARSAFERIVMWCRRQLVRRARFNVLPQESRCHLFQASTGTKKPILCVWNCPRLSEVSPVPRPVRRPDQPLGIYYHGSINLTRFPLALIEAAGATGLPIRLRVVGYETAGSQGASESLRRAAQRFSPRMQLVLPGPISREKLFEQMVDMHLGWIAFSEEGTDLNLRHLAGASNKAFDYLAAGLPLLCNKSTEWQDLFAEPGYALACDTNCIDSIAEQLLWAYANPQVLADMGEMGRINAKSIWNYETQFKPVADLISTPHH